MMIVEANLTDKIDAASQLHFVCQLNLKACVH